MKTKYFFLTFIIGVFTSNNYAADGDRINLESPEGMKRGTIFFAPETDLSYHNNSAASSQIYGTEIYTTWGSIEKSEGVYDWSYIDNLITKYKSAGKKVALRIATTNFSINDSPEYLYTKYNIRRIVAGYWENFEKGDKGYIINGTKTTNAISGSYSVQMSSSNKKAIIESGLNHVFDIWNGITNPSFNPTQPVYKYRSPGFCVQFDFKANASTKFYAKAYSRSTPTIAADSVEWTVNAGENGSRTFQFNPKNFKTDYKVEIGIVSGNLTIDNVNICDMKTAYYVGTLCFPNYFDPKFKDRYEVFVQALANRYKDEITLNSICIAGYGRWEEITLSDDIEPFRFEDQWTTYGFTNQNYIDHIKWCIQLYKKYFTTKRLYMGAVGWNTDPYRDQVLIDWKIGGYAAKQGVGIKYNGWQAMCGDWGSPAVGFFYLANRYKFDKSVWTMFEEGGQINNTGLTEIMGHPISLLNRASIDGIDYNWMYQNDLQELYINRYFQYANQTAGSGLFTKMYNLFGTYPYFSPKSNTLSNLKNIWMGVFQNDLNTGTKWTYSTIDGVKVVQTNPGNNRITFSIDDRQRYNGMYGAKLILDYLDKGNDEFSVYGNLPLGMTELKRVKKQNSGLWKSVEILDNGWTAKAGQRGVDILNEIEIDDRNDGVETFRMLEIEYVPALEWQERVIQSNSPVSGKSASLSSNVTVNITNTFKVGVSGIALNINSASSEYVNVVADVSALINGNYISIGKKEYYMPDIEDWFYIPMAKHPLADAYRIVLCANQGNATIQLGSDNLAAYRLYSFESETGQKIQGNPEFQIEALKPFAQIQVVGQANTTLILKKKLLQGDFAQVANVYVDATGKGFVEPQTAGIYQLTNNVGQLFDATPNYLKRLSVPTVPIREVRGSLVKSFYGADAFRVVSGLKNIRNDNNGFSALLSDINPVIANNTAFSISSTDADVFKFVIKNETSASLSKIYWKTNERDYSEENSMVVPIVPNDTEFREYSYPMTFESGWSGTIVGIRFLPVFGNTATGKIGINSLELRKGTALNTTIADTLKTNNTDFFVNPPLEISSLKINNGNVFTENKSVTITSNILGGLPTHYKVSEKRSFENSEWLEYANSVNYTLSDKLGTKIIYFKVKDFFSESPIANATIIYKIPTEKIDASTRTHVNAYPNPVKSTVKIDCTDNESEQFDVTVMTLSGSVYKHSVENGNFNLDVSDCPSGVLLIKIANESRVCQKIILKN